MEIRPDPFFSDPLSGKPAPAEVRAQLERVLASPEFAHAGRHSRLLRYVVERTLAGEGDQLKEYVLGTEVFDRPVSYDPRLDSIVRVEVRRLRARLDDYYRGAGAADPVVISIPRGSYAPQCVMRDMTPAPLATGAVAPAGGGRSVMMIFATATLLLVVLGAVGWLAAGRSPAAQASTTPGIAVLPFEHFSTSDEDALLAARMTDAVTTELARLRTLSVASRTGASQYGGPSRSMDAIRAALRVDYVLEASAVPTDGTFAVSARLVDASRDRKVWVQDYAAPASGIPALARRIAAEAADAALAYHARTSPPGR